MAVVDRDPELWAKFIEDKGIIGPMIDAGRVLLVTVSDDPQVAMLAERGKAEAAHGLLDSLPKYTADGFSHPSAPAAEPPAEPSEPAESGDWAPVETRRLRRSDAEALDAGELWAFAGLEGADDPVALVAGRLGATFTRFDLAETVASLINSEVGAAEDEVAAASGAKVLVDRAWLDDVRRMLHGAGERGLLDALLDRAKSVAAENYRPAPAPPAAPGSAERPAPRPPAREERPGRPPPQERRPDTSRLPPDMLADVSEAHSLAQELQSSRLSLEAQTGYSFNARRLEAACSALERALDALGAAPSGGVEVQGYDPADTNKLERLLGLMRSLLRRRRSLEDAGVNPYPLQHLREDVAEFLQAIRAAGPYDVLQRRAILDMASGDDNNGRAGRVAERLAARMTKVAIQLSKGNLRATKGGTITIDPGLMNCPVVREVIRELPSKASDMEALRKRLEDLGMIVTQGDRGQLQVYCLIRTEGDGGAKTKMCQWFTDAHGNDGKFKIECAKN